MPDPGNPPLGGSTVARFLRKHWQKEALLVRDAVSGFTGPFDRATLSKLAARDDVQSRLVVRDGARWSLSHGPFARAALRSLPARNWTLLVQSVNLHMDEADALLRRFAFLPFARLDDLMVSYAAPGGGVGPHFDSYDVFLLQGFGRRRWRYGRQADLALRAGLPLRILRRFAPDEDRVLGPGDMLYLPPHYAHDGTAIDGCTTYSIGFRAPSAQELAIAFLDFLRDDLAVEGRYADAGIAPNHEPARIGRRFRKKSQALLSGIRWDETTIARFLGCFLTEPKAEVVFARPRVALSRAAFARRIAKHGVRLDRRTQLLYDERRLYVNGEEVASSPADAAALRSLANHRRLSARACAAASSATLQILYGWYRDGFVTSGD
jgi:50S ribosomal protein L16 3-hydroxylase